MLLINTAIKRRVFTVMIYMAVLVLGLTGLSKLSLDFFPELDFPMVVVLTQHNGVGPAEIETSITKVIEGAVASAEGIEKLTANSKEGLSIVTVQYQWGTDLDAATADLRDKLDQVRDFIPDDASKPIIFRLNTSNIPVAVYGLMGNKPLHVLYDLADDKLKDRIEQVDGVAQMSIEGGRKREVHVLLSRNRLDAYKMTPAQIVQVLRQENLNFSGGNIKRGYTQFTLRTQGEFKNIDQIRNVVLAYRRGVPIYLKYVAEVKWGISEETSITKFSGTPGLRLVVRKQSGANTVEVVAKLQQRLKQIEKTLPQGVRIVEAFNTADFVTQSIKSVSNSGILGGILAVFVVLFFLRNVRASIIIGFAIPASVLGTFIAMYFADVTLNIVSLGGLALGIGMLVDNAIVVLENTFSYMKRGQKPAEAARLGAQEVAMAIFSSTLTTVCVFLPIVFTDGLASEIFKEMALTVAFSLMASLFVSLTLVPMLSARYLKHEERRSDSWLSKLLKRFTDAGGRFLDRLDEKYKRGIGWALDHRKTVIFGVIGLFLVTMMFIAPGVKAEFMPENDEGNLQVKMELPAGTRLKVTHQAMEQFDRIIQKVVPEKHIKARFFLAGNPGGFSAVFGGSGPNFAQYRLKLVPKTERDISTIGYLKKIQAEVDKAAAPLGIATLNYDTQGGGAMMGGGAPIDVLVRGYDLKKAAKLSAQVAAAMRKVPGLYNIEISRKEGVPELRIEVNRTKAASVGLSIAAIGTTVQQSMLGEVATFFRRDGKEYDVLVRLKEQDRKTLQDIENIQVLSPLTGKPIRLKNIAKIVRESGPVGIERDNQERVVHVTASTFRGLRQSVVDLQKQIGQDIIVPSGFTLQYSGSFEDMQDTFLDLAIAMIVAILLVYAVMASIFESFLDPFIIFFTIPLSLIGVIWMLLLTDTSLNVNSMIGVLVLFGIVVNNGIVLVDYINILRARGYELFEGIQEAGRRRLRPILMTATTTILAMIPLAIGMGEGSESSAPLARAVVGGLSVSTVLSLFLVPVIYASFELKKRKRQQKKAERKAAEAAG